MRKLAIRDNTKEAIRKVSVPLRGLDMRKPRDIPLFEMGFKVNEDVSVPLRGLDMRKP